MSRETDAADDAHSQAQVDVRNPTSLQRWSQALKVTPQALQIAVQAVGPRVDRIKDYLGAGGMAADQEGG